MVKTVVQGEFNGQLAPSSVGHYTLAATQKPGNAGLLYVDF